jgi:hypothetical protein
MEEHTPPDPLPAPRPPTRPTTPSTPHLNTQTTTPPISASPLSLKMHLEALLAAKERQLQQAVMLGQRVLVQQAELEERIRQLEYEGLEGGEEGLQEERRARVRELGEVIVRWEKENEELSRVFGEKVCFSLPFQSVVFFVCVFGVLFLGGRGVWTPMPQRGLLFFISYFGITHLTPNPATHTQRYTAPRTRAPQPNSDHRHRRIRHRARTLQERPVHRHGHERADRAEQTREGCGSES